MKHVIIIVIAFVLVGTIFTAQAYGEEIEPELEITGISKETSQGILSLDKSQYELEFPGTTVLQIVTDEF